jgi:hypothetical protein
MMNTDFYHSPNTRPTPNIKFGARATCFTRVTSMQYNI